MSMMSYDAWRVSESSHLEMKRAYKKWVWRQELCLLLYLGGHCPKIIHQVAFTRSFDCNHP